jgi:hypothetical protein
MPYVVAGGGEGLGGRGARCASAALVGSFGDYGVRWMRYSLVSQGPYLLGSGLGVWLAPAGPFLFDTRSIAQ